MDPIDKPTSGPAAAPARLSAEQQQRACAVMDSLLDLPEAEQSARLAQLATEDPAVAAEAASLLRAASAVGEFLASPAQPTASPGANRRLDPGARVGAWRILHDIGQGGMGEVYEAERVDGGFSQRAAVKLLRPEASTQLERFHAERQILARLDHPGIARLLDGGITEDGRPYMAMELVQGRSITAYCEHAQASLDTRLQLFVQVCDAVAYAHRNLVVHRDLKPDNILVSEEGRVKLLDFGIAKLLVATADASAAHTVAAPLTPSYAAPEQLTGAPITTATDVYALGLLLFELLTGERVWAQAETPVAQVMRAVLDQPAPLPSAVAKSRSAAPVPARALIGDLDAIVGKALRPVPSHRYASVDAFQTDVGHARRGEAVAAREGARLYTLVRALRHYRWAVGSAAAVFVALAFGLSLAAWQAHRAAIERDVARLDAAREEALRYHLTGLFRSAIAQHGDDAPTAKSMLDKSAQRVLREYRDQPQLAGQVVLTLADLYDALQDVQGSAALLEGFLAEAGQKADPFAVADARQKLAGIELMRGHVDRSGTLLDQAEAYWAHETRPHAEERLEGLGVRARWQRARNDLDGSIATLRTAIAQRIALSGHDHRETATLYNSLAITLTAANRLEDALAAYKETSAIYDKLGLGDGLDAQIIRGNTGTLALRTGRLREAEGLLKGAFEHERALAGDSAAVAAALGYYGKLLLVTDRAPQAIDALKSAVEIATRYTGADSPVSVLNRLFLGEAQCAAGERDDARVTLEFNLQDALSHYGKANPLALRTGLALAVLDSAEGRRDEARARLQPVIEGLRKAGPQGQGALAEALVALGDIQLAEHATEAAKASLQEALSLRSAAGEQNWELAQARERLGEALAASGASAEARRLLETAQGTLQAQLGEAHPESRRAQRALEKPAG